MTTMIDSLNIEDVVSVSETAKQIAPNTVVWLLILLVVNIAMLLLKFYLDWIHGKNDIHNYKRKKISEESIEVESKIYAQLLALSIFQKDESHQMLDKIQELDSFIEQNSLYISKKYRDRVDEAFDYFKEVVTNYNKKDNKKEGDYFRKLSKSFYGE